MTPFVKDAMPAHTEAAQRIVEIDQLYASMRKLMQVWLATCNDPSPEMPKKMMAKLSDIQAAHTLLLKAEERFHDLCNATGGGDPAHDIDAIRSEIGGMLDRLRDAAGESGLSGSTDG